ncbi:phage tail assembly protein [Vreelandella venusta]|uniref:Phage tail assembly protein n=1 Tax=Vreelandella venusta TaxID=44935 RepID=A0ABX2BAI4_9GAMM|nr:phage tail assembly protein [Halomonas venusta]AZM95144.1 phage tail assembly protein [Halomonas venusta]NPT29655.1 phage tail assembly protein [Halomonas venusta]
MTQQTENQIEAAAAKTATAPGVPTEVVELETPLQRGKNTVTEITVRKPMSGGMRGVSLVDIMNLDVAALTKVMPRITTPALTEAELKTMDIVDLVQLGTALNGFLTPKKFKEIEA